MEELGEKTRVQAKAEGKISELESSAETETIPTAW